jgi:hypothetical protein
VYLPGEIEQRHYEAALERGSISYPASVLAALRELGDRLGEPVPDSPAIPGKGLGVRSEPYPPRSRGEDR